jgi:hypothetical protein
MHFWANADAEKLAQALRARSHQREAGLLTGATAGSRSY